MREVCMSLFKGNGVAAVVAFNEDLSVNFDAYENFIKFLIKNEADAIIVNGTTGESATLSDEEQLQLIKCAVKAANGNVPIVAGAGSNNTNHALHLAKQAKEAGANGILAVTPYYNKPTQEGLVSHFELIANACQLPTILYNVPGRTGCNNSPATCAKLSKNKYISGIKEASGNITQIAEISALTVNEDFSIYSGNDSEIVPTASVGGIGVISVLGNIAPKQTHDMVLAFLSGDTKKATKMQLDCLPLVRALFVESNPIPVKTTLNLMGLNMGGHRLPLTTPTKETITLLEKEMKAYGIL